MFVQLEVTIKKTVQVEVDENVCEKPNTASYFLGG